MEIYLHGEAKDGKIIKEKVVMSGKGGVGMLLLQKEDFPEFKRKFEEFCRLNNL